ncbi:MAG: hypothetical protein UZ15_CFX003002821 [Chloroflexi bacterium OLB15]|nr:MAG: hypothetical protein UZ15_CFX003002821 [Chloroflexi bacterium OLB15]
MPRFAAHAISKLLRRHNWQASAVARYGSRNAKSAGFNPRAGIVSTPPCVISQSAHRNKLVTCVYLIIDIVRNSVRDCINQLIASHRDQARASRGWRRRNWSIGRRCGWRHRRRRDRGAGRRNGRLWNDHWRVHHRNTRAVTACSNYRKRNPRIQVVVVDVIERPIWRNAQHFSSRATGQRANQQSAHARRLAKICASRIWRYGTRICGWGFNFRRFGLLARLPRRNPPR